MYEDKTLVCKECGKEFVFTAGEQEFYAERGFQNEPQRCKACRDARKNSTRGPREFFTATCARCGGEAKVPFEPKSDRPVYCSDCFAQMRGQNYLTKRTPPEQPFRGRFLFGEKSLRGFPPAFCSLLRALIVRKGGQLAHWQPEKYFLPGTRPGRK